MHKRFQYKDSKFYFDDHEYNTLEEMLEGEKVTMELKYPCYGSRFSNIFIEHDAGPLYVE